MINLKLFILTLGVCLLNTSIFAETIRTQKMKADELMGSKSLDGLIKEWKEKTKVEGEILWTPYLPTKWPLDKGDLELVSYGVLEKRSASLADGHQVSAPVIKASFILPEKAQAFDVSLTALVKLGAELQFEVQGVRPLNESELKTLKKFPGKGWAQDSLGIWKNRKLDKEGMEYFCLWAKGNGLTYGAISERHSEFFKSLKCI